MRDPRSASPVDAAAFAIARELLGVLPFGVLPFGARPEVLARCPQLAERVVDDDDGGHGHGGHGHGEDGGGAAPADGERAAAVVVEAIETFTDEVDLPDRHPDPLPPALVRRVLHVLLATRDLGWPGTDAPLSVRRVAAADLFFDATQTVLPDDDWKGPNGVEFALLTALAGRICRTASLRASAEADEGRARSASGEVLGRLHRVQRPRRL